MFKKPKRRKGIGGINGYNFALPQRPLHNVWDKPLAGAVCPQVGLDPVVRSFSLIALFTNLIKVLSVPQS